MWNLLSEWDGTRDRVHDVRHELNLLAGSLVTVAYGLSKMVLESSQSSSQRQTETVCPVQRVWSENGKRTKVFVMSWLISRLGKFPVLVGYIYTSL